MIGLKSFAREHSRTKARNRCRLVHRTPFPLHDMVHHSSPSTPRLSEACRAQLYGRSAEVALLQEQLAAVRKRPPSDNSTATTSSHNNDGLIDRKNIHDNGNGNDNPRRRRSSHNSASDRTVRYCFVSGLSGSGKTTLVQRAFDNQSDCLTACGKFEKANSTPFAALTTCFTDLGAAMMKTDAQLYRQKLRAVLEPSDVRVLQGMMPNIGMLWGNNKGTITTISTRDASSGQQQHHQSKDDLERLKYILRLVLVAIALPERPVVFHLDDLQWIDAPSLAVVQTLFHNSALQHCLFVGSYRSDELSLANDEKTSNRHVTRTTTTDQTKVVQWMNNLEDRVEIHLSNLSRDDLQAMLCVALQVKPYDAEERQEAVRQLAETLHKKTDGNAFHFLESLDYLQAEGLLTYNPLRFQWTWDIHQVQNTTSLSDNMVGIVVAKIQRLPENARKLLELCSLMGFRVDLTALEIAFQAVVNALEGDNVDCECKVGEDSSTLEQDLEILTSKGLLEALQENRFKFSHDKVYQAALELQSTKDQTNAHLVIGRELRAAIRLESCESTEHDAAENRRLFLCVDQLNLARHLITDESERMDLVKLNLLAAHKAAALSAFVPAAEYAQIGNSLLGDSLRWTTDTYDLSLELTTLLAVMSAVTGEMEQVFHYTKEVNEHGRTWLDKLRARSATMEALSAKDRHAENYQQLVQVLAELGRELPTEPNQQTSLQSMKQLAKTISSMSDEEILSLPEIQCEEKIGMLDLLGGYITTSVTGSAPHVVEAVGSCMISEILKHGLSPEGAVAFALMANRFDSLGETQLSRRCSKISRTLAKRDGTFKVRALVGSSLSSHWTVSLSGLTDMTLKVFTLAMRSGDLSSAFHACLEYTSCYFYSGLPLPPLYDDCKKSNGILHDYGRWVHRHN